MIMKRYDKDWVIGIFMLAGIWMLIFLVQLAIKVSDNPTACTPSQEYQKLSQQIHDQQLSMETMVGDAILDCSKM